MTAAVIVCDVHAADSDYPWQASKPLVWDPKWRPQR